MNYLSAENISKSFGEKILFEGLNFGLTRGDKTALIARNGAGKTTLLRILSGKESTDSGEFKFRSGIKTTFLEQIPELDENLTIQELILSSGNPVLKVIQAYEEALHNHSLQQNPKTTIALEEAINVMDQRNAWQHERRLQQLLDLFRITSLSMQISLLSGGEKKRVALAFALLDEPDLLVLDEPTNHLDIDMIEWLENYLSQNNLTLLMVTHDRYFLDRVCNRIMELHQGNLYQYKGNYEYFLQKRAEREENLQVEADRAGQLMRKELDWLRRMPKARTGKSKARIDAFEGIESKAKSVKKENELKLHVKSSRLGGKVLELDNLSKDFGSTKIINNFSYKFTKGERLGVIGRNGSGKSTFLDLISGLISPDTGKVTIGETVKIGYFRQMGREWDNSLRVIDAVKEIAEVVKLDNGRMISASQFLDHFMFPPESQYKLISKLSGGEIRRLNLLTVLIKNPNFLILDEPTNDLDLITLNRLEEFLEGYSGCLVIVSHDRYLLDKLTDHLFIFHGNGLVKDHYGTYSDYRLSERNIKRETEYSTLVKSQEIESTGRDKPGEPANISDVVNIKTKLTFKEKQEYITLEKEIKDLELEKNTLEQKLDAGNMDYVVLNKISSRIAEIMVLIDDKTIRWMELDEFI